MNILYCIDEFPPIFNGGMGTYAKETTKKFIGQKIHPMVLSRNPGSLPVSDLWNGIPVYRPDTISINDTTSYLTPCDVKNWGYSDQRFFIETIQYNLIGSYHYIRKIQQAKKNLFHLVIAHGWTFVTAGLIIKENLGIPFIFHFHSHEQGRMENPSKIIMNIEKIGAEKADAIITVSHAMKSALINIGYPEEKIHVIYNGADIDFFNPGNITQDNISKFRNEIGVGNHPMILYVGKLTRIKGVDELIRAMPEVIREIQDVRLVILGVGELEQELNQMREKLGLLDIVIMNCQYVSEQRLKMYYAACDCAVFPSKYEAFGMVCTEAMAMAKPVIVGVAGTSGLYEQVIIRGGEQNGFHINPYSPADIAKHLCILLKDPEMRRQFGHNGRNKVLSQFTWDITIQKTADIYHQVLQQKDQH